MAVTTAHKNSFTVKAYSGDNKTLLAFNFPDKKGANNLAGFTIQCAPPGQAPYYLFNELQFQDPSQHAQVAAEPANSSVNAPIHKFRWVHVPGTNHQGAKPATGAYRYTVTPRYFDDSASMQPPDRSLGASLTVNVGPFIKKGVSLPRSKRQAAISAGMYLSTDDSWTHPYFNPKDLHCMERELFG